MIEKQTEALRLAECVEDLTFTTHTQATQAAAELRRLHEVNVELLEALEKMIEPVDGAECRTDHHGYCQSHFLDDVNDGGCRVANARSVIAKATGAKQ